MSPIAKGEGYNFKSFVVELDEPSDEDVKVTALLRPGTANTIYDVGFNDRLTIFGSEDIKVITIKAGELSSRVQIMHYHDREDGVGAVDDTQRDESYVVELVNPEGAVFADGEETLRVTNVITQDDLALFVSDPIVVEGDRKNSEVSFEVQLSRSSPEVIELRYETKDGTASAGTDYVKKAGSLVFQPGELTKKVTVQVKGDRETEISETFSLYVTPEDTSSDFITDPWIDALGNALVLDNDATEDQPVLTIEAVSGIESIFEHLVVYRLSKPSEKEVSFELKIKSDTADKVKDVSFDRRRDDTKKMIKIPAGDTVGWVSLEHITGNPNEYDERYQLEVSKAKNAALAGGESTFSVGNTILNDSSDNIDGSTDEGDRSLFISDVIVAEGSEGSSVALFEVGLTQPSDTPIGLDYTTFGGTATTEDYKATAGRLRFLPGEVVKYIPVTFFGDRSFSNDKTVLLSVVPTPVSLDQLQDYLADNIGTLTIENDDRDINEILGSDTRKDELFGGDQDDRLFGLSGNDLLEGGGGLDELIGGKGKDTLKGGAGADLLDGGDGFDFADYSDSDARVIGNLREVAFRGGDAEGDTLLNIEAVIGSSFGDLLYSGSEANLLIGGGANDRLVGGAGADTLEGGGGSDVIKGGNGKDVIRGDGGADRLIGGGGKDTFVFSANNQRDSIVDFDVSKDILQLDSILVDGLTNPEDVIDRYAEARDNAILFVFEGKTAVRLVGLDSTDGLEGALIIV